MWWVAVAKAPDDIKWKSFREVLIIGIVSTLPIWLGILAANMKGTPLDVAFAQGVLRGQLLFYAMSFCGSIIWLSAQDLPGGGTFPPRPWYVVFAIVCTAVSFVVIGVDPILAEPKPVTVNILSVLFFVLSAALYWAIIVMTEMPAPSAETINRKGVKQLSERFDALQEASDD